jgi:hypothetical protein
MPPPVASQANVRDPCLPTATRSVRRAADIHDAHLVALTISHGLHRFALSSLSTASCVHLGERGIQLYLRRMIIEAGYDLATLLFDGRSTPGVLRMVMLDTELRLVAVRTLSTTFTGTLDSATLEAVDAAIPQPEDDDHLARFTVRYVALGFDVPATIGYPEGFDWDRVKAIEERLADRGVHLLGIQVTDGEAWASTGPMYSFESYALEERIPRILVIPGPHPFLTCECAVCAPRRANWERATSSGAGHGV